MPETERSRSLASVTFDPWHAAREAYSAWCRTLANAQANHRYTGPVEPAWEFLDQPVKEAWKVAAESVAAAARGVHPPTQEEAETRD